MTEHLSLKIYLQISFLSFKVSIAPVHKWNDGRRKRRKHSEAFIAANCEASSFLLPMISLPHNAVL